MPSSPAALSVPTKHQPLLPLRPDLDVPVPKHVLDVSVLSPVLDLHSPGLSLLSLPTDMSWLSLSLRSVLGLSAPWSVLDLFVPTHILDLPVPRHILDLPVPEIYSGCP